VPPFATVTAAGAEGAYPAADATAA
jgi:hypothetical protein